MQRSMGNSQHAITEGHLGRTVWGLARPVVLSQLLLFFSNLSDAVWLGQLGHEAQAAAGAVVARYVGARDKEGRTWRRCRA